MANPSDMAGATPGSTDTRVSNPLHTKQLPRRHGPNFTEASLTPASKPLTNPHPLHYSDSEQAQEQD
jgi:hypothetical protein